MENPAFTNYIL